MRRPETIADDTPNGLKDDLVGDLVTLVFGSPAEAEDALPCLREYATETGRRTLAQRDGRVELPVPNAGDCLPDIILALAHDGLRVRSTETRRPTLDDVFFGLTGRTLRESGTVGDTDATREVTV